MAKMEVDIGINDIPGELYEQIVDSVFEDVVAQISYCGIDLFSESSEHGGLHRVVPFEEAFRILNEDMARETYTPTVLSATAAMLEKWAKTLRAAALRLDRYIDRDDLEGLDEYQKKLRKMAGMG